VQCARRSLKKVVGFLAFVVSETPTYSLKPKETARQSRRCGPVTVFLSFFLRSSLFGATVMSLPVLSIFAREHTSSDRVSAFYDANTENWRQQRGRRRANEKGTRRSWKQSQQSKSRFNLKTPILGTSPPPPPPPPPTPPKKKNTHKINSPSKPDETNPS